MSINPLARIMPKSTNIIPAATHRGQGELPFVSFFPGILVQLVHADVKTGLWVTRMHAQPGVTVPPHTHMGDVCAFTLAGAWKYLEYPEVNTAGSYLYEPEGSSHSLHILATNTGTTDAWFAMHGGNATLDADGNVVSMVDAKVALDMYLTGCREAGLPVPDVIT